jgi:hypothetical protein
MLPYLLGAKPTERDVETTPSVRVMGCWVGVEGGAGSGAC